jgi:general secretion pathway protein F
MLLRIAGTFERATERSIERAMGILTPALTILIAGLVGALVLTVMNAVLGINELATQ